MHMFHDTLVSFAERRVISMRTFEVGKRYGESAVVFEITKRTAKTVTYAAIHHAGRYNESRREEKRVKVHDWGSREVFFAGSETVEA